MKKIIVKAEFIPLSGSFYPENGVYAYHGISSIVPCSEGEYKLLSGALPFAVAFTQLSNKVDILDQFDFLVKKGIKLGLVVVEDRSVYFRVDPETPAGAFEDGLPDIWEYVLTA